MHFRASKNEELLVDSFNLDKYPDMSLISLRVVQLKDPDGNLLFEQYLPLMIDFDAPNGKFIKRNLGALLNKVTGPAGDANGNYYRVQVEVYYEGLLRSIFDIPLVNEG